MLKESSIRKLFLMFGALGLLLGCLFGTLSSPKVAAEGECINNCDSTYTSCRDGCMSDPFLTSEQRSACLRDCQSSYGGCSSGCFDPQCHRGCGISMQACYGQCQAEYDVCSFECNGDSSCINVCLANRNSCGGFCNAADIECRMGCDGEP